MTDNSNEIDQAERIRRLQARRAASGHTPAPAAAMTAEPSELATPIARTRSAAPRRQHPAARTRWILGGLSVLSFFTIAGTVGAANVGSASAAAPVVTPVTANAVATTPAASNAPTAATATTKATTAATSTAHTSNTKTHGS